MNEQRPTVQDDEISLVELFLVIKKGWWIILLCTILAGAGSVWYIKNKIKPYFTASTIFMLTGNETKGGAGLGAMGMLTGLSGLGGGSSDLTKLQIITKDLNFNSTFVKKNNLLPKLFPERLDSVTHTWSKETIADTLVPDIYDGGARLMKVITVSVDAKTSVITLSSKHEDSLFVASVLNKYVAAIDAILVSRKRKEANTQIAFLEQRYYQSRDPWFQEKIQEMISTQMEQLMLFSTSAIDIVAKPLVPKEHADSKKKLILVVGVMGGLFMGIFLAFALNFVKTFSSEMKLIEQAEREKKKQQKELKKQQKSTNQPSTETPAPQSDPTISPDL